MLNLCVLYEASNCDRDVQCGIDLSPSRHPKASSVDGTSLLIPDTVLLSTNPKLYISPQHEKTLVPPSQNTYYSMVEGLGRWTP